MYLIFFFVFAEMATPPKMMQKILFGLPAPKPLPDQGQLGDNEVGVKEPSTDNEECKSDGGRHTSAVHRDMHACMHP